MKASWRNLALMGLLWLASACAGAETSTPLPSAAVLGVTEEATQTISTAQAERYAAMRQQMVTTTIEAHGVEEEGVLKAMRSVPRHFFVPQRFEDQAYGDHPLPIGYGQTISQPFIVAWMTELLDLQPGEKVLEIGTGSGYQAAVLAELQDIQVYSVEIVPELAESAKARLQQLGYDRVQVMQGDGYYGWEEHAPYDAILVTAAPDHLPSPLVGQLAAGGRLVIPIGPPGGYQTLWQFAYEKGELQAHNLGEVAFVPFTGEGISQ